MGLVRLSICITGIYASFLLWAVAQERLSAPFTSISPLHTTDSPHGDRFPSSLFLNFAQACASCAFALAYLLVTAARSAGPRKGLYEKLGLNQLFPPSWSSSRAPVSNGIANGHAAVASKKEKVITKRRSARLRDMGSQQDSVITTASNGHAPSETYARSPPRSLLSLLLQVSACQTLAGPIGFAALRHISYPTMVLGKSCKLIPVLLLNVMLYRRRFSSHKYLVVGLVTLGISLFMLLGESSKKGGNDSLWGLGLLMINLLIDGMTNSTQDQIFALYPHFTGQQMMFAMSSISLLLLTLPLLLPLPTNLDILTHIITFASERTIETVPSLRFDSPSMLTALRFITSHPTCAGPIIAFATLGGLGQLFIFETIQHFGSLTLVMVTVTRKLVTMLLSVVVFRHRLSLGQWAGVGVVFSGIGVEAGVKRRDMLRKARRD